MPQQQPTGPRPRFPLAVRVANRFASKLDDSRLVNGFIEQGQDDSIYVYQRPGLDNYFDSGSSSNGNGVYNWNGDIFAIFGPTLYKNGVAVAGTVNDTNGVYTFSTCLGSTPKLFLQNGVKAYTYDTAGGLVEETYTAVISVTGDTHTNTTIDNISPNTTGMAANASVSGAGIPLGTYIVSVDSGTKITINTAATATASGVALTVNTVGFPLTFVKGSAYLDSTTYVMTPDAAIYGSGLNNPTTWDPLNKIIAQIEPDKGKFVAKQLVYVVAFKAGSVEIFYDAANATGSPLGPVQGAKVNVGCWSAGSVQQLEGILIWVSQTQPGGGIAVMLMEGLKANIVSTPPIERLLEQSFASGVYSWSCRIAGHRFYGLTIGSANLTVVYDIETKLWYEWTDSDGNYWPFVSSASFSDQEIVLQHRSNGKLYTMSLENATDAGAVIAFDLYTPNWDGETRLTKMFNRMDFVGDQIPGCVLQVRFNDWDYDPTRWSQFRSVDMNLLRPNLKQCGSARRRILHIRKRTSTRLRLEAIELDVLLGTN